MYPDWLVVDDRNPKARKAARRLVAALGDAAPPGPAPTVVVGGDGFLLRTVAARDFTGTFLGLNAGNLGFLHSDVSDWSDAARMVLDGKWFTYDFPLLRAKIELADGGQSTGLAMNDVYLERSTGQAARIALFVDGREVVGNLVADGLIVATALGSTAYSFSAGGSPAHPLARLLKITPICPHLPRLAAFDLPATVSVRVEVRLQDRRPVRVVIDGAEVGEVRAVEVRTSSRKVRLAFLEGHDFTSHLLDKIVKP